MPLDPSTSRTRDAEIAAHVMSRFAAEYGRLPSGVFVAPGRVNLIGEHLDYNGGRCLPFALPQACYVASGTRDDVVVTIRSEQLDDTWTGTLKDCGPGCVTGWASYAAGVIWSLREDGFDVPGLDLVVDSRVPIGAGLSSSAALECSVALAACHAAGVALDQRVRDRVVAACIRAENEVAGAPTGGLDQTVAMFAETGHALLLDFADGLSRQVPWDPAEHDVELLVVDTRVSHAVSDGGYGDRRADCEQAAELLGVDRLASVPTATLDLLDDPRLRRRTRHVVSEQERVAAAVIAIEHGDMPTLGDLLNGSHRSLRDDFEVSCPELDAACAAATEASAYGARMTGGGFGGSAIALIPSGRAADVMRAVEERFSDWGWRTPSFLAGVPSAGARQTSRF